MKQTTLARRVEGVGIGLHKGEPIQIALEPLEANSGILFYRKDVGLLVQALPHNVVNTQMATVIGNAQYYISTIEHLLSAIYAYGIDNVRVVLDGAEVPVMDGSSASFCMMLDEAGIRTLDATKQVLIIKKEVEVHDGKKFAKVSPSLKPTYSFIIDFDHPSIGKQEYHFEFSKKSFIEEISRARTFGFLRDVQMLRSKGLALGGSLDNAVVMDDKKILNPEGLRFSNEFVRHKILDAIGDLSLLGAPFVGDYASYAGSHNLNHELTKEILKDPSNYEIRTLSQENAQEFQKGLCIKPTIDIVVISLSSPLQVGIYDNNHLIKQYETKEQTSEALPTLFQEILENFTCKRLFFAKGPGSFMAIKISYVFLKTLSISLGAPLYACDGFMFNANRPIRAMRNLYFMKENGQIVTQRLDEEIEQIFELPHYLDATKFDENTDPLYMLPAV